MGEILLNLTLGEPLALVKKSPYFDDPIKLDVLLESGLCLGFHDSFNYLFFNVVRIEFYRGQVLVRRKCLEEVENMVEAAPH